ncbi:MAG TPA: PEGA domain-containing protein, partial [Candidatus Angelobacter sp.]
IVLVSVLLVAVALGGYGYYRYRNALRVEKVDRELEQRLKQQQIQQAAADRKAVQSSAQQQTSTTPVPPPAEAEAESKPSPQKPQVSPNAVIKNRGELRFDSQPRGAKVQVDGWTEPTWITPFQASNLSAGTHTVVFSKAGYLPETRTVDVTVGKSLPFAVQMKPAISKLVVNSTPQGANIEVDGKDTGMITPAEIVLEKGDHTVLLRKPGFKDVSSTETLAEGQTWDLSPVLLQPTTEMRQSNRPGFWRKMLGNPSEAIPEGKGMVHIHTVPEGATIQVGDQVAPRKTNVMWPVDPGTYDIVLRLDGYKPVRRTIRVQKGRDLYVDEILERR